MRIQPARFFLAFILFTTTWTTATLAVDIPLDIRVRTVYDKTMAGLQVIKNDCKPFIPQLLDIAREATGVSKQEWQSWHKTNGTQATELKAKLTQCRYYIEHKVAKKVIRDWFKARAAVQDDCKAQKLMILSVVFTKNGITKRNFDDWKAKNKKRYYKWMRLFEKKYCGFTK